ncbi:hypothetical protein V7P28_34400 [Klebsiella michiganensis]
MAAQWRDDEDLSPCAEAEQMRNTRIFVKYCFTDIRVLRICSASAQGERSSSSRHCAATLPSSTFVD